MICWHQSLLRAARRSPLSFEAPRRYVVGLLGASASHRVQHRTDRTRRHYLADGSGGPKMARQRRHRKQRQPVVHWRPQRHLCPARRIGDRSVSAGLKANSEDGSCPKHTPVVSAVAARTVRPRLRKPLLLLRHKGEEPDAPLDILIPDQQDGQMGQLSPCPGPPY